MRSLTALERIEGEWIIDSSGNRYKEDEDGKLHCEYGPALIMCFGSKHWWYHGRQINCSSQEEFERLIKLELFW